MTDFLCPLRQVEVDFDADAEAFIGTERSCWAPLHLVWSMSWPISDEPLTREGGSIAPIGPEDIPRLAYTDGWEVKCENGHVLANHSRSADDNAEPFDLDAVMKAIGALRGGVYAEQVDPDDLIKAFSRCGPVTMVLRGCFRNHEHIEHSPHYWSPSDTFDDPGVITQCPGWRP